MSEYSSGKCLKIKVTVISAVVIFFILFSLLSLYSHLIIFIGCCLSIILIYSSSHSHCIHSTSIKRKYPFLCCFRQFQSSLHPLFIIFFFHFPIKIIEPYLMSPQCALNKIAWHLNKRLENCFHLFISSYVHIAVILTYFSHFHKIFFFLLFLLFSLFMTKKLRRWRKSSFHLLNLQLINREIILSSRESLKLIKYSLGLKFILSVNEW
jgi:hypothetical protein